MSCVMTMSERQEVDFFEQAKLYIAYKRTNVLQGFTINTHFCNTPSFCCGADGPQHGCE